MRDWENWAAGAALIICLLIAWFAPILLHLTGTNLWILRGGLALVAVAAVGALWWWLHSKRTVKLPGAMPAVSAPALPRMQAPAMPGMQPPAAAGAAIAVGGAAFGGAGSPQDIDVLIREAERRLKTSEKVHGATFRKLPAVFLVGEAASGKTSVVLNSGLDPELLAGQVSQDGATVPTRAINAWFARQAVFVEAGSALLAQPAVWTRLVKRLKPGSSILSKGGQAPRAVVVCVDCETLAKPGGSEAVMNTARILQPRLREFAERLGINLPVYVLFSKLDRVAFFTQYVDNLSHQEVTDVLGVTLPIRPQDNVGIYAEQETKRLAAAFDELFYSLSDRRLMYLPREHGAEKLPAIYEFPREFRKLRNSIVQFLVDLCRPSQLRTGPFLRGFYFTGQRTVVVDRVVQAQPQAGLGGVAGATRSFNVGEVQGGAAALSGDANATFVFDARRAAAESAPEALRPIAQARQVQQPVYLSHLFNDVVLSDRAAMGTSGSSTKASFWRRLLLATAIVVFLVASIGFLVSYFGNRGLEVQVAKAAQGLAPYPELSGAQVPTFDALQRLDGLRQTLVALREPPPLHLRWGLYVGDDLYTAASQIYFACFRKLLFAQTQSVLLDSLRRLPATPGPQDDYKSAYDALKAYLITTSNHDKSTREFLSPELLAVWSTGRDAGEDRRDLARRQFDFYSEALVDANPYSSANDARTVAQARAYLSHFAGTERVYQSMLAAASARNKPINFNHDFPGSSDVVINHVDVPGAFTKGGWTFMQDAIKHPERFFSGEEWVLGPQVSANLPDPATLSQTLRARYQDDFVKQWRAYLNGTAVVHYQGLPDAARKLTKLSGNPSALLQALCVAATNTAVDSPDVAQIFQPAQFVTPPPCQEQLISQGNKPYMDGLVALESCLEQVGTAPPAGKDQAKAQCGQVAGNAKVATRQVAQGFKIDQQQRIDAVVQRIMLDPITTVEGSLMPSGPAGAGSVCASLNSLAQKAPFRLNASDQASLQDIENIFHPGTGMLSSFYSQNLTNFLTLQGSEYVPNPTSPVKLNPAFVSFFNRAMALQHALYPGNPPQLEFHYSLRPRPTPGGPAFTLTMDGQTLKYTGATVQPAQFVWPGSTQGANLSVVIGGAEVTFASYQGPMSVFQFFANSKWAKSGQTYSVEWSVLGSSGQLAQLNGKPLIITFDLDTKGADPIFRPGYFSSLGCVSKVSQ
ncbi:MAG TPA: ImcF-related family protein [Terriglobia bacterium]|nr:ImcF-related family protein [Terriglobia bacterium]